MNISTFLFCLLFRLRRKRMRLCLQLFDTTKYCAVHQHPYLPSPLYTYQKNDMFTSDLPGNELTPINFISAISGSSYTVADITPVVLDNYTYLAWTPEEPVSKNFLIQKMYDNFIPSFIKKKGISEWSFITDICEASKFKESDKETSLFIDDNGIKFYYNIVE